MGNIVNIGNIVWQTGHIVNIGHIAWPPLTNYPRLEAWPYLKYTTFHTTQQFHCHYVVLQL